MNYRSSGVFGVFLLLGSFLSVTTSAETPDRAHATQPPWMGEFVNPPASARPQPLLVFNGEVV